MKVEMSIRDRHKVILELIETKGHVEVAELSRLNGVSDATVRRDLEILEREGLVKRIHGGAISKVSLSHEPAYNVRAQRMIDEKIRIGRKAASLISEGETIVLDVGTTTTEVARALKDQRNITVFTPSLWVANILADEPGIVVMVSGGIVRRGERSLVGDFAERAFNELVFDTFIMGIAGIHTEYGLTEYNLQDSQTKRSAIKATRRTIVVADGSKLGKIAFAKICHLNDVDALITDNGSPNELEQLYSTDIEIIIA